MWIIVLLGMMLRPLQASDVEVGSYDDPPIFGRTYEKTPSASEEDGYVADTDAPVMREGSPGSVHLPSGVTPSGTIPSGTTSRLVSIPTTPCARRPKSFCQKILSCLCLSSD